MGELIRHPAGQKPNPADLDGLTAPQMLETTGITYRQLNYWTTVGYLRSQVEAQGSGIPLVWSVEQARAATLIRRLCEVGLGLAHAAAIARAHLGQYHPGPVEIGAGITIRIEPEP